MWPFPILINYSTDAVLSELFLSFSRTDFEIVRNGVYELHLRGPMGEIKCWNANQWYAWASEGNFTPAGAAEASILWKNRMPSRWAMRQMRRAFQAVEGRRLRAAARGEVALNLDDYRDAGYVVRRPTVGANGVEGLG